jgi:hypothetical protein
MRLLTAILTTVLLGMCAVGCADTGKRPASRPRPSPGTRADAPAQAPAGSDAASTTSYTEVDADRDNDVGAPYDDTNNDSVRDFGDPANAFDREAIAALIKRYYAAAAVGDGAMACSMLSPTLASSVAEDYGPRSAGPPYLHAGTSCPTLTTLLFRHFRSRIAAEIPLLEVRRVRIHQHQGLALLSFGRLPERQIPVAHEEGSWKIDALLDSELP